MLYIFIRLCLLNVITLELWSRCGQHITLQIVSFRSVTGANSDKMFFLLAIETFVDDIIRLTIGHDND